MMLQIRTASEVETKRLDEFLSRLYPVSKSTFLRENGSWWHKGNENRWVLVDEDKIAGYCAIIPTKVNLLGETKSAVWWVDLIIAPQFRGRHLQSHFDEKMRNLSALKLGFPNKLAAKIHRKHGWRVREDFKTLLLPLQPTKVKSVRTAKGNRGTLMRLASHGLTPLSTLLRWRYRGYQPKTAREVISIVPEQLADIYRRYQVEDVATTTRDEDYIRWRYLEAPYRDQLSFYIAGPPASPTHYLVTRNLKRPGGIVTRILDFFGDFSDQDGLEDILQLAIKESVIVGSNQVTVLLTMPALQEVFCLQGFLISTISRFCWYSDDPKIMELFDKNIFWCLADSDNDTPE